MGRLARKLGISVAIRSQTGMAGFAAVGRRYITDPGVNWGCGSQFVDFIGNGKLLNGNLNLALSKRRSFEAFEKAGLPYPRWSNNFAELRKQIGPDRDILHRVDGQHGGSGIDIIRAGTNPVTLTPQERSFFVERLSYQREARVHVWCDEIIATQVKLLEPGNGNPIHSFDVGNASFTTKLEGRLEPALATKAGELARAAVKALGLDFGAVDLMLTKRSKLYVLEVNTAPGIRSKSIEDAYSYGLGRLKKERK